MRANEQTALVGNRCVLVPYLKRHVERYHEWMKSAELQEMTASEPLSIEEEYEMQQSWHLDEKKCTFIILARDNSSAPITAANALDQVMIGDVNLFFNDHDDPHTAEIEIMIAEPAYRRQGRGVEALKMMMAYARDRLQTSKFVVKISTANPASIQLFTNVLNYEQVGFSEIFQEITLERNASMGLAGAIPIYEPLELEAGLHD